MQIEQNFKDSKNITLTNKNIITDILTKYKIKLEKDYQDIETDGEHKVYLVGHKYKKDDAITQIDDFISTLDELFENDDQELDTLNPEQESETDETKWKDMPSVLID